MNRFKTAGTILLLMATLVLGSCGSGGPDPVMLTGFADADAPLVGASISVYGPDGAEVLPLSRGVTGAYGGFEFDAGGLPPGSMVTASGGTYQGRPFTGTLRATLGAGFQSSRDAVYLTPVTTLVSAYLSQRPGTMLADATARIHATLKLPAGYASKRLKRYSPALFSGAAFMSQGAAYQDGAGAGFDRFTHMLAANAGQGAPRTFVTAKLGSSPAIPIASGGTIPAPDTTNGALSDLGNALAGALFKQLLMKETGIDIDGIATIQNELDNLSSQITTLGNDMSQMNVQLGCEIATFNNDIDVAVTLPLIDAVVALTPALNDTVKLAADTDGYKNGKNRIVTALSGLQAQGLSMTIYGFLQGAGTSGAVRTYGNQIQKCKKFLNATSSGAVVAQWTYASTVMASACALETAYLNWILASSDDQSAACKNTYIPGLAGLASKVIPPGSNWVIDMAQGNLWATLDFAKPDCRALGFAGIWPCMGLDTNPVNTYLGRGVGPDLAALEVSSGLTGWAVPSVQDTDWFLNGSARQSAATTQACLVKAGYTDGDKALIYGPGEIFLWVNRLGRVVHSSSVSAYGSLEYASAAMRWDGHVDDVCATCTARIMAVRPIPAGDVYWQSIEGSAPAQWKCPDA